MFCMILFKHCMQIFDDDDDDVDDEHDDDEHDDGNNTANTDSWQYNNHGIMFSQSLIHADRPEDMQGFVFVFDCFVEQDLIFPVSGYIYRYVYRCCLYI